MFHRAMIEGYLSEQNVDESTVQTISGRMDEIAGKNGMFPGVGIHYVLSDDGLKRGFLQAWNTNCWPFLKMYEQATAA